MPEPTATLQHLGLEEQEAKTYLALLDLGEATASKLAEHTGLGRVHMYQLLNKLMEQGLASHVLKNNVKYFLPADPETILNGLQEKEQDFRAILPELQQRWQRQLPEIKVEVYKGREGFRSVLKDRLNVGGDLYSFGVDEAKFKERFGTVMEQLFRQEKEQKLTEYILTSATAQFMYQEQEHIQYRGISEKYFDPTPTAIYADRVLILIWEPLTTILIKNKPLADAYRKHFMLLWNIAQKK